MEHILEYIWGDNMDLIKNLSVKTDRISARVTKEELILIKNTLRLKVMKIVQYF